MLQFIKNIFSKVLIILLLVLSPLYSLSQCDVHIVDGSVEVVDTSPGVKFIFDLINEGSTPWTQGTLHFGWTLESSNPGLSPVMWDIELSSFQALMPGETITLESPVYDLPAVWENPLSNNPSPSNPWVEALEWPNFNSTMFPNGFTGAWSPFRLTLGCDTWDVTTDQVFVYNNDGSNYYGPEVSGCPNINGDFLCDCDIEYYNFNLSPTPNAEVIIKSDYNCFPVGYPFVNFENPGISSITFGVSVEENSYCVAPMTGYYFMHASNNMIPNYQYGDTIDIDLSNTLIWENCLSDYVGGSEYIDCFESVIWQINNSANNVMSEIEVSIEDNIIVKENDECKLCDLELISVEWPYITVAANQAEGCYNNNLPAWLTENPDVIYNFTIHFNDSNDEGCSISFSNSSIPDLSTGDTLTLSLYSPFPSLCYTQAEELISSGCEITISVEDINGMTQVDDFPENNFYTLFPGSPCMADLFVDANLETQCDPILGEYVIPIIEVINLSDIIVEEFCIMYSYDLISGVDVICYDGLNLGLNSTLEIVMDTIFFNPNQEPVLGFYSAINVNGIIDGSQYGYDFNTLNNSSASILVFDCIYGCMDPIADNYNINADVEDGSCEYTIFGCIDPLACNFNPDATEDDGFCEYPVFGYDCEGNCLNDSDLDGVCDEFEIPGCTDPLACNYNPNATDEDGTCEYPEFGYDCDGDCLSDIDNDNICDEFEIPGCTDPLACNYNPNATDENGSCEYPEVGYDCDGNCLIDSDLDGVCDEFEVNGCTDINAVNYNPMATEDDSSCIFITESDPCDDVIKETFIPNAMTPNGDGYNDVWGAITHPDCWRTWDLRIYNRWGILVWLSNDPSEMWDGISNNNINNHYISEGVYVYSIQAVSYGNDFIQKTGFIVVIK